MGSEYQYNYRNIFQVLLAIVHCFSAKLSYVQLIIWMLWHKLLNKEIILNVA